MRFFVTEKISENIAETPEGFLLCSNVPITRIGEFIYRSGEVPVTADRSGMIRIQRDEADVFEENTIRSFEGKPVTINHPGDFVSPENWSELAHGTVQNVRRGFNGQGDLLLADLLITTEEAIELVKSGLREVSCGYDAQYEEIEEGLGRQKEIIGNHVALVSKGRAGKRCAIGDKTCDGCGNCGCGKTNIKEDDMGIKAKLKKWIDSFPFKDDDLKEEETEEQKAAQLAEEKEEAKDKKSKDRKFKDEEEEEDWEAFKKQRAEDRKKAKDAEGDPEKEKKPEEEEKVKAEDKKSCDDEGGADLSSRLARLEKLIEALLATEKQETALEAESLDKKAKDEGEEEDLKKKETEEEAEEEQKATEDCISQWPEIVHRAEILFPGMNVRRPTKDHAKTLRAIKIGALKGASIREDTRRAVETFAKGKDLSKLTNDALDAVFLGASELLTAVNNRKVQSNKIIQTKDIRTATDAVQDINARNRAFYQSQNK